MKKIKIFDELFSHVNYSCLNCNSDYILWESNPKEVNDGDIVFFTDLSLSKVKNFKDKNIKKYAWILESPVIFNQNNIFDYIDDFDIIFTFRNDFLEKSDKFKLCLHWCSWIKEKDKSIYDKTKLISTITSSKRQTEGHILRHDIISYFGNKMDVYGRGYNPIEDKIEGLKDYMFHIVVENVKQDFYFSEKLLDCFSTGTVPLYWGCPSINKFFNEKGIIHFNGLEDLYLRLKELTPEKYQEMIPFIKENYDIVRKYRTPEDYLINYDILK